MNLRLFKNCFKIWEIVTPIYFKEQMESMNADLKLTKEKMALLMREYQDLLNAKMALEIEITTYR